LALFHRDSRSVIYTFGNPFIKVTEQELVKKAQSFAGNTELSSSTGAAPPSNENPDAQSVVGGLELPSSTSDSTGDASSAGVPADTKA